MTGKLIRPNETEAQTRELHITTGQNLSVGPLVSGCKCIQTHTSFSQLQGPGSSLSQRKCVNSIISQCAESETELKDSGSMVYCTGTRQVHWATHSWRVWF